MKRLVYILSFISLLSLEYHAQITIDPGNTTPFDYENIIENVFLGNGVEIVDVKYFGDPKAVGVFDNAESIIGLNRGIIMTTGHATDAARNSSEIANEDTTLDQLDDEDLESLLVNNIDLIDMSKYEISFIPTSDTLRFRYVFASEEYPDFVCTSTNDVFGFFISGPDPEGGNYDFKNIALVPDPADPSMGTFLDFPVSVNFVNGGIPGNSVPVSPYCEEPLGSLDFSLYYNESDPDKGPVYNAFLDIFIAEAAVIPCQLYTIKIAIADGRLGDFDSAVFLEEKSFSTRSLIINLNNPGIDGGISEGCQPGRIEITLPEVMPTDFPVTYKLLTDSSLPNLAIEGLDFEMLDNNIVIPSGELSFTLEIHAINDFNTEGTEYIYLEIIKDVCNKDTIRIPISDNSLNLVSIQDSLFTCANTNQDLLVQLDSSILITEEQRFENNKLFMSSPQDSIINSEIIVTGLKNDFLTENMIAEICIDLLVHQRLEDLDIYLQAPNENILELSTDNGWRIDNDQQSDMFVQTCFSLSATENINLGNPVEGIMDLSNQTYTGSYLPEGSIENWLFPSQPTANGVYNLIVIDDQADNYFIRLEGWHITFNASYEIEYEWFPGNGLSCTDCDSVRIKPQQSQYYYLRLMDSYNCDVVDSIWVEAYPLPDTPSIMCDSVDVTEIHLSWEDVMGAEEYEILINGKYPWVRINSDTTFLRHELKITTSTNNKVDLHGFLPEEEAWILMRSVSENGCLSSIDTIFCQTLPCLDDTPQLDSILIDQPICDTDGNARVDIYAYDKDGPLTYRLLYPFTSFENETGIFFSVQQGTWPVRIIDTTGCITEDTIRVFDPLPLEIIADITPISCRGYNDGAIDININSSSPPYTYEWNISDLDNKIENLEPGRYDLTVTDTLGCTEMATFVIDNPPKLEYEFILLDSINCSSTEGAQVFLDVSGGEGPYDIKWSTSQVGPYINTFIEGPIQFTITDNRNCFIEGVGDVIREEGFEIIFSDIQNLDCFTIPDGQATINIAGGVSPFEIQWNNGETGDTAENLLAGPNNVTVTDSEGCQVVGQVSLDSPPAMVILHEETPTSCFGSNDGQLEIDILGGQPGMQGYNIFWDNGSQNPVRENLVAGTYCLTVTDEYNCSVTACFQVSDAEEIDIQTDLVKPFCYGDESGEISVTANGGSGNYSYNWSGPNAFSASSAIVTNLISGIYIVTVSDDSVENCDRIFNIELTDRSEIEASLNIVSPLECHGVENAVLIAESLGGSGPFEYTWSDNVIEFQENMATQIGEGIFNITITDSDNCTAVQSIQLEYPPAINFMFNTTDNICFGDSTGTVEAIISGGNGNVDNFELLWDIGISGNQLSNLPAGFYSLTATDENACSSSQEIEVLQPLNDIVINLDEYNTSCNADKDGRIDVFVSNAVAPIIYSIIDSTWQSNNSFVQLTPGSYPILIRDSNGCMQSDLAIIEKTANLLVDAGENILVEFGGTVTLNATVMNHTGDVDWEWTSSNLEKFTCPIGCPNPEVRDVTKSFSAKVTATDSKNCSGEDYVTVNVFEEDHLFVPKAFSPNSDGVNDKLQVFGNPKIHVLNFKIYSRWGELLYHDSNFFANDTSRGWNGFFNGEVVNQGTYVWTAEYQLLSGKIDFSRGQTTLLK